MAIDLSKIKAAKTPRPPRILVHGPEGIGKSTFFSKAPNPIFCQTEDGLDELEVAKFPAVGPAESYAQVMEWITELYIQDHNFKTAIIDSADWLEVLVWKHVVEEADNAKIKTIEDFGYGKGYIFAAEAFRKILDGLNALRLKKNMVIGLTAHSLIKRFDDPNTEPYDRYVLKLHQRSASVLSEWADIIGFASQLTIVKSEEVGFEKVARRGIHASERLLWTQERPAFIAKNRYTLPESILLEWKALSECISQSLTTNTKDKK